VTSRFGIKGLNHEEHEEKRIGVEIGGHDPSLNGTDATF
jgi:hypothetical protein